MYNKYFILETETYFYRNENKIKLHEHTHTLKQMKSKYFKLFILKFSLLFNHQKFYSFYLLNLIH